MIEQFLSPWAFIMVAWATKFGLSQQSIIAFWGVSFAVFLVIIVYGGKLVEKFAKYFLPGILLVVSVIYYEQIYILVEPFIKKNVQGHDSTTWW